MQNNEVEIIKLGDVVRAFGKSPLIMTVEEDDPIISHYLSILRDQCSHHYPQYGFMKTKGIVRSSSEDNYFSGTPFSNPPNMRMHKHRIGVSDGCPVVGQSFTINNSSWHTSKIEIIIRENIIITKNSIYAIHDLSTMRYQKLNDLGI